MRTEQLRHLLLDYLKATAASREQLQYAKCLTGVQTLAQQRCPEEFDDFDHLRDEDGLRLKHVIWDLILERVLVPSKDRPGSMQDGWPFLSVTDHGKKVISEQ